MSEKANKPRQSRIGQKFKHDRLGVCRVMRVRAFGTIDVRASNGNWYRISGLPIDAWTAQS
jgi:hypothetical protein